MYSAIATESASVSVMVGVCWRLAAVMSSPCWSRARCPIAAGSGSCRRPAAQIGRVAAGAVRFVERLAAHEHVRRRGRARVLGEAAAAASATLAAGSCTGALSTWIRAAASRRRSGDLPRGLAWRRGHAGALGEHQAGRGACEHSGGGDQARWCSHGVCLPGFCLGPKDMQTITFCKRFPAIGAFDVASERSCFDSTAETRTWKSALNAIWYSEEIAPEFGLEEDVRGGVLAGAHARLDHVRASQGERIGWRADSGAGRSGSDWPGGTGIAAVRA